MRGTSAPGHGRTFRRARIAFLIFLLIFTAAWGAHRYWHRRSRGSWEQPIQVGLVLLSPDGDADAERWRDATEALSLRLDGEMARWRGPGGSAFQISVVGPVRWSGILPFTPSTEAPLDRAGHAVEV